MKTPDLIALAILNDTTQNRTNTIGVALSKEAKARRGVQYCVTIFMMFLPTNFANANEPLTCCSDSFHLNVSSSLVPLKKLWARRL